MSARAASLEALAHWHEGRAALRMVVAAVVAYSLTNVIKLPGAYSAVLTTIIVARSDTGGTLRASFERLAATLLGAGVACAAAFGRIAGLPEMALIVLTLSPLALVVAHNGAYRTSMIAAIIVLSAADHGASPVRVAALRAMNVGLGAVVGAAVSMVVTPSSLEQIVRKSLAELLPGLAEMARAAADPGSADPRRLDAAEVRVRRILRELGARTRRRRRKLRADGGPNLAGLMVRGASRLNADMGFLARELERRATDEQAQAARTLMLAFADWAEGAATAIRAKAPPPPLDGLASAGQVCREAYDGPGGAGVEFLTGALMADAATLARGLARSRS